MDCHIASLGGHGIGRSYSTKLQQTQLSSDEPLSSPLALERGKFVDLQSGGTCPEKASARAGRGVCSCRQARKEDVAGPWVRSYLSSQFPLLLILQVPIPCP